MKYLVTRLVFPLLAMFIGQTAGRAVAQEATPASPSFFETQLPFEQKWFVPHPNYPATRVWRFQNTGDLHVHTTARSVGPESALLFYQPKGAKPGGEILIYDVGALENDKQKDLSTYKGVTFWMRGDGGDGEISLGCNWNQTRDHPAYPRIGKFPLSNKQWTKYFVPWEKFAKPPAAGGFYFVNVRLEPASDRAAWAVISRLSLYKEEKTEPVMAQDVRDPDGMIPAEKFVEPSVVEAQKLIPKTVEKLKNKQPVTIVATGDSITAGAQLWYMNPEGKLHVGHAAIYFSVLQRKLAEHYGYDKARFVFKMWQFPDKKKNPEAVEHFKIMTGQTPEADGSLPFDGLQVIGVGAGGKDSRFAESHLNDVTQFKPDLVIWAYGANDALSNRTTHYHEPTARVLQKLREQGIEVIIQTITPFEGRPYFEYPHQFGSITRELAKAAQIPLVDQFGAFTARGERYIGDLYSDTVHPNEYGHEIMAATLAAALGVPDQHVWNRPLFRAIAAGEKIPD